MKALVFTGMPGSGKSEAVKIAEKRGIPVLRMGELVWEEVSSRGMKIDDSNVGKIATEMREKYGMDIWARRTIEKIGKEEKVVIDGVRNLEEIDAFKEKMDMIIIAIHSSPSTRYKRLTERQRRDDPSIMKKIIERDRRELKWGIGGVMAMADVIIINEGGLDEFRTKVERILKFYAPNDRG